MKMKKILFSLVLAIIIIAISFASSVFAATDVDFTFKELNLNSDADSGTEYSLNNGDIVITKIGKKTDSGVYERLLNAYCAMANVGFESRDSYGDDLYVDHYNKKYTMNTDKQLINLYKDVDANGVDKYNKILALADLFYIGKSDEEYRSYIKPIINTYLISTNQDYATASDTAFQSAYGMTKETYLDKYCKGEPFEVYDGMTFTVIPAVLTPEQIRAVQQTALWYFTNGGNYDFTSLGSENNFLYYKNGASESPISMNTGTSTDETSIQDKQAYFLYTYLINTANANATIDYEATNNVYLYLDDTTDDEQPIIEVEKVNKIFDLALRKYITKITRDGSNVIFDTRVPNIDTENTLDDGKTTADYKHRKDPVPVERGDKITYTLTIYNEGTARGKAIEIKDQLPTGLSFDKVATEALHGDNDNYTFGYENNVITITAKDSLANLDAYTTGNLSSTSVQVVCTVEANPDNNIDKIFTNVAWISKAFNAETNKEYNGTEIGFDIDSAPGNHPEETDSTLPSYKGNSENKDVKPADSEYHYKGQQDDDDFEKIILKSKKFDLALRKFITKINDENIEDRIPAVKDATIGEETTLEKDHTKKPRAVSKGDIVVYTIRVYNEGDIPGTASEVADYLPEGLEFITPGTNEGESRINYDYGWSDPDETGKITTNKLAGEIITPAGYNYNNFSEMDTNGNPIYYRDLKVECRVKNTATSSTLKNVAEITEATDENGNHIEDVDSTPGKYGDNDTPRPDNYGTPDSSPKGRGYEDDDDYEDLKLVELDLALRKFITRVGTELPMTDDNSAKYTRAPVVAPSDIAKLYNGEITTAEYKHIKTPVEVKIGDYVEYTLRVYNEGLMDGYAREITDHLPPYLEFVECEENTAYGWSKDASDTTGRTIKTDYLKDTKLNAVTSTILDSSDRHNMELKVICRVVESEKAYDTYQTNIAEITKYGDKNNTPIDIDRDSQTIDNDRYNGLVDLPDDKDLPNYKGNESNKDDLTDYNYHYKGQQDDDDFEKVHIQKFDLALRKFITKVETLDANGNVEKERVVTDRVPQLSIDETTGNIKYTHTKEPLYVRPNDIVTYTLRIFNEGDVSGFASVITDDIPDGVAFIPAEQNATNKEYGWQMYTELADGIEVADPNVIVELNINENNEVKKYVPTTDVSKASIIRTDYLSYENGVVEGSTVNKNLIKAFDKEAGLTDTNPDYRDIKVAFRVTEQYEKNKVNDKIITNFAQISDDQDENGKPVNDIDSTPDKWKDGEDDQDIEKIRIPTFDLNLRKWVTQAIVYENGEETVTNTNHDPWDDPEDVVKVELHRKKLSDVTVKFRYSIRVYNDGYDRETGKVKDGFVEGYAKEVTDYIPEGLMFVQEDNPDWTLVGDNIITTNKLENTLLKPGEYADVEVLLTWINGEDNLGLKTNVAEISKDENEWGAPDWDSTPNNKTPGEDDIDDAPVMLSITTGEDRTIILMSIGLGLTALVTIAGGVFLIKKYVM